MIFGILSTILTVLCIGIALITFKNGMVIFFRKSNSSPKFKILLSVFYLLLAGNYIYYNLLLSSALDNDTANIGGIFGDWHLAVLVLQLFLIIALQISISSHKGDTPNEQVKRHWADVTEPRVQRVHLVLAGTLLMQFSMMAAF